MTLRHVRHAALFALDETLIKHQVPYGVRALCALGNPVRNTLLVHRDRSRVGHWVVVSQDFKRLAPWIAGLFGDDEAILRLFCLANTRKTNRKHGGRISHLLDFVKAVSPHKQANGTAPCRGLALSKFDC